MPLTNPFLSKYHLGSFVCEKWELRVTARCLEDDLGAGADTELSAIKRHEIIKSLVSNRATSFGAGGDELSPIKRQRKIERDEERVWVLRYGHRHRGVTFYDEAYKVIWLMAYHYHESGAPDDFFPWATELANSGEIWPTPKDHTTLERDRRRRVREVIPNQAQQILKQAHASQGTTIVEQFETGINVEVQVEVLEEDEELYLVLPAAEIPAPLLEIILTGFDPEIDRTDWHEDWYPTRSAPMRQLGSGEACFWRARSG